MKEEIIIAGYGGQGTLLTGMILAQAALESGLYTTWFPAYGAEMRGGTANSTVVISDEEIGSPVVKNPTSLIALNEISFNKFSKRLKNKALVIYNFQEKEKRKEERGKVIITIPATEMADKQIGNIRTANMIALGVYIKESKIVELKKAKSACEKAFAGNQKLIDLNHNALDLGFQFRGVL